MRRSGTEMRQCAALAMLVATLSAWPNAATAAEHRFSTLLDTDFNSATGCTVPTANGPVQGVERVATTVVATSTVGATVTRLEMQTCNAGELGAPSVYDAGGWNVGLGNGTAGTAVIETSIPLSSLPTSAVMRAVVASTNATAGRDATPAFAINVSAAPPAATPVPLSPWLVLPLSLLLFGAAAWWHRRHPHQTGLVVFLLVVAGSGLVWAASVVRDGNVEDWLGVAPAVTDPSGDAPINADVVAVLYQQDAINLYLRIDADVRKDVAGNTAPVVNAGANQTITLPALANLAGTATDDGLPNPPGILTTLWGFVSGPGTVTFGNAAALATTATFSVAGSYVLRLTADDSALSATSTVQITVNNPGGGAGPQLAPIPDRTIPLGARFQQVLAGSSPNVNETLTYSLTVSPAGAALSPPPLIDWTPTAAQVGTFNFTAKVTDSQNRSATQTFRVTVVHTNQAPQLAPQADATVRIGTTFTRTLTATDPDAGDTLTFALVSGPAGMTLTAVNLSWPTSGKPVGDYPVTVKVTDGGGLSDTRSFTIKLLPVVPPATIDESYEVRLGQTLAVNAALGVLANDLSPEGLPLTASKLSDPSKGTLNTFNADGSFNYAAPPTLPGPVFAPVVKYSVDAFPYGWAHQPIVIDVDGDGVPEIITSSLNPGGYGLRAYHVAGGALTVLWDLPDISALTQTADCTNFYSGGEPVRLAAGDIDDSGQISIVFAVACKRDIPTVPSFTAARYMAVNARDGTFKWLSPSLGGTRPEPLWGGTSEDGIALNTVPSIARMRTGESPSVVFAGEYSNDVWGAQTRCEHIVAGFTGTFCRAAFVLDGSNGTVRQKMIAPATDYVAPVTLGTTNTHPAAVVADLEGTGDMNVVFGATVWNADGSIKWNIADSFVSNPHTHVYTYWNGLGNFDDTPDIEIVRLDRTPTAGPGPSRLAVFKADGRMLWSTLLSGDANSGIPTIADIDGSGRPSVVLMDSRSVCAIDYRGLYKWCHDAGLFDVNTTNLRVATRAAVYDLDGDGVPEVIVPLYGERLRFLDGATGKIKFDYDMSAGRPPSGPRDPAGVGSPIIADFENNGHASLLTVWIGAHRMDIVASQNNDWRPARKIFNQTSYFIGNVNDNGSIPQTFVNSFANPATNVFGTQGQILPPVDPRIRSHTSFTYSASAGGVASNPGTVTIELLPTNRPPVFTSIPPTRWSGSLQPFDYLAHATDPDVGDTITYSLVLATGSDFDNGASTCTIVAATGALHCNFLRSGEYTFIIAATDSQGERALQTVHIVQSAGPATVPNVVGQSKTTADATLIAAGFVTGTVSSIYSTAPVDQVLAQAPSGGATALQGEAVALQISKGRAPQVVPNLVGLQLVQARALLVGLGLTDTVTVVPSATAPANEVVAQNPAFGTTIVPPAAVALDVSMGPPLVGTVAQVIVEPAPSAIRVVGEKLAYRATAIFTDGTSTDVTIRSLWLSSAPAVASVDAIGGATALTPGGTTISAQAGGKTGQATLNVVARTPGDGISPVAQITTPSDGATVTGPISVVGTATDANFLRYELAYALAGDTAWTVIGEGTSPVTAASLGTFDPTSLINDQYTLRLTVFDRNGNQTVATTNVQATGARKPGLFTLAYLDLNLPSAGIPVTVTRTYDSRDKAQGDFGIGWRLDVQTLRLRTNRVPGTGWLRTVAGPTVSLTPTSEHKVSLALPDGKVEQFDLLVSPTSGLGSLDFTAVIGYAPRPGTVGKLEALGNLNLLILNAGAEEALVDDTTLATYEPALYRYTTSDGTKIEIGPVVGVKRITDRNGNSVIFGPSGILHSTGKNAVFTRDSQNRITQITDPLGNAQTYRYDGNGDLISHSSATGDTSRYRYDRTHNLVDVEDPAGNHPARNDYDASGRLIATTDAKGNQITYTHNLGASTELIRDRLGNPTLYAYDAMGNVLSKTDALGFVTTYTYDSRNNPLAETDPLGRVSSKTYDSQNNVLTSTDFEGNTTISTYNSFGQVLTGTDPEGRVTTNVYDTNGNLTRVTNPDGGITLHAYDGMGNPVATTDPLGRTTTFSYDVAGNRTSETDPLGHVTTYTYNTDGHRLGETDAASKTTSFAYDANGRLTTRTDKSGNKTTLAYSNVGLGTRVSSVTDATGNVTSISYDAIGNLTATTYPDGSVAAVIYDANNRRSRVTDPDGRVTTYAYDAVGHTTLVTLPSGATKLTSYDAAGRVLTQADERGFVTTSSYAPNQRTITDPLGSVVINSFDSRQRVRQTTDPLGHVTSFTYDSGGNLLRTTYADGTFKTTLYDAAGQRVSETDQAGRTTQYAYNAAGQLTRVTNALGGITAYAYDAVGNRVTQTDAIAHTTQMTYDPMGRVVSRAKPSGKQESFAYDALGNEISHADFNGKTTTFVYDALKRLTRKNLPDGTNVDFAYTAAGLRTQAGGDRYTYDAAARLMRQQTASGETVTYAYDSASNRTSMVTPQGATTYTYDALNRLKSVVDTAGATAYTYDQAGRKVSMALPNGVTTVYGYDVADHLVQIANMSAGAVISSYAYTLGPTGNRVQVAETGSATTGRTVAYTYDALFRLTQEQIVEPSVGTTTIAYIVDGVGNRLQMTRGAVTTTYSYDSSDRLLAETSGGNTVTSNYDDNGNLVGRAGNSGTETFGYDGENRLRSANVPSGAYAYAYDADGMRTGRATGGVNTAFLLDKNREFAQVIIEVTGASILTYTYGDRLISQRQTGGTHFYLADGQQSTRQLTSVSGAVTDSYSYDAFGVPLLAAGTTANAYRYVGEQLDSGTGLYYLRARYLNPATERFLTSDPASGSVRQPMSMHPYLYCNANPINCSDPSGRETLISLAYSNAIVGVFLAATFGPTYSKVKAFLDSRDEGSEADATNLAFDDPGRDRETIKAFLARNITSIERLGMRLEGRKYDVKQSTNRAHGLLYEKIFGNDASYTSWCAAISLGSRISEGGQDHSLPYGKEWTTVQQRSLESIGSFFGVVGYCDPQG